MRPFSCPYSYAGAVRVMVEEVPFYLNLHVTFPS